MPPLSGFHVAVFGFRVIDVFVYIRRLYLS